MVFSFLRQASMHPTIRVLGKSLVANLLPTALFHPALELAEVKELFSTFVRVVEIENHSYCNRTCAFCPNAFIDRGSQNLIKDEKKKFSTRTGLELSPIGEFDYRCLGSSIQITMGIPCYTGEHVSTRGGLVDIASLHSYQRRAVCFNPLHSVVVDYNGKGMLCCQVRSDSAQQSSAVIGDLTQPGYTLFHFYRDLASARAGLLAPGPKNGVCRTCNVSAIGPDRLARRAAVANAISQLPGMQLLFRSAARRIFRHRKYE